MTTEVLIDGFNENGTSTTHSPEESVTPEEYQKDPLSPPADAIRLRRNVDGTEVHLQIPMEKLGTFHGYVATTTDYPNHQPRYQRIRYVEYRGQPTEETVGSGFDPSLIKYEHLQQQQQQQQQPGKIDPNSSYVTLESVTGIYQQQQQQQQQQVQQQQQQHNYQQQPNSYQAYQPYEQNEQPTADMFNMYEKVSHGIGSGGGGGDYEVKNGHQKSGYGQQLMQQQQQQQQQPEYQDDGNGGGGESGQPDFWVTHEQPVTGFATSADETLAANALQMEAGLGPPDDSIQVTPQYTIFQTGNPGPSWIDEHYDQSTVFFCLCTLKSV